MTVLERRYRRMLVVLPKWYRAEREEEMVAAFLEDVDRDPDSDLRHDFGWPGWGEFGSLVALSARTRWPGRTGSPRAQVRGEVVRVVGLIGLLLASASALNQWLSRIAPELYAIHYIGTDGRMGAYQGPIPPIWDWRFVLDAFLDGTAVLTLLALLFGAWRLAKAGASVLLVVLVAFMVHDLTGWDSVITSAFLYHLICVLYAVCVLVGFHSDVEPVKPKWWLVALVGITALWMSLGWTMFFALDVYVLVGAVAYLVVHQRRLWRAPAAVLLAVAAVCALLALERLVWTPPYFLSDNVSWGWLAFTCAEIAGLVGMAVWLRAQAVKVLPPETRSPLSVAS
ncbi:hypothetical protein [Allokutzneria sp. NRRL B-24872]|uniref:hypothetical protein n=1 Tax=Allokutzneria sp. NRRL B-24872 TaxID=1137961 RepID=UPI000A39B9A8|nr:hypothetical protein [Allokutzneria sp. NRRL B-24872]